MLKLVAAGHRRLKEAAAPPKLSGAFPAVKLVADRLQIEGPGGHATWGIGSAGQYQHLDATKRNRMDHGLFLTAVSWPSFGWAGVG